MIHLYHATKVHASGTEVLQNAFFSVAPGSWVVVTGEGRAGKSTLLKLLCGEEKATWGKVVVDGREPALLSPAARSAWLSRVGLIFPDLGLLPGRTVQENLLLPPLLRGEPGEMLLQRALELLETAGLSGKRAYLPEELSQSEQRMTAALRAILSRPALLLADEPFQGLSPKSAQTLLELLTGLHQGGSTLVLAAADWKMKGSPAAVQRVILSEGKLRPASESVEAAP
jgi:cell division transport system ATP-binding protein